MRTNAEEVIMAMKRFLVTYLAPASVIEAWKKTPAESRKAAEANIQNLWKSWMSNHHNIFVDKGAGVGKRDASRRRQRRWQKRYSAVFNRGGADA